MPAENDFLAFATGGGANVVDQADYDAAAFVGTGFQAGLAQSAQLNKVWRQSSFMACVLATLIVNETGSPALDDGDVDAMVALLLSAIQISARTTPTRVTTSSAGFTLDAAADGTVGFNRTAAPAPTAVQLPADAAVGQEFSLQDLAGNFSAYPITVTPAVGSIAGRATWVLNTDNGDGTFKYFGGNLWGVKLG